MEELVVTEGSMHGKLTLKVEEDKLIEKYSGGMMGYIYGDRTRVLSLVTLAGVKVDGVKMRL